MLLHVTRIFSDFTMKLKSRHTDLVNSIFEDPLRDEVVSHINAYLKDLISIINGDIPAE